MRSLTGIGILMFALGGCGAPEQIGANNNNVLAAHCYDKIINDGETDVDCGGECNKCDDGRKCGGKDDCLKGECTNGVCGKPPMCNAPCNFANGVGACENGKCVLKSCNAGFDNCNANDADGCETDVDGDSNNCGGCGKVCNAVCARGVCGGQNNCGPCNPANAQGQCVNNKCVIAKCNANFADCDQQAANGCEVDMLNDAANCGACGMACKGVACVNGMCGGNNNCGPCAPPNAVGKCAGNQCIIWSCNAGFLNCDGQVPNGCEVDTNNDAANCGGCGIACMGVACAQGACGGGNGANCNKVGFVDCDRNKANGCETLVTNDPNNCGACGVVCGGGKKCANGICV